MAICDLDVAPAFERSKHHEEIGGAIALVLIIETGRACRFHRDRQARRGALPGQGLRHLFSSGRGLCNARGLRVSGGGADQICDRAAGQPGSAEQDRLSAHAPSRTTSARDPAAGCDAAPLSRPFAGAPSRGLALFGLGYSMSGLEGFARTAPLFAAWLYSGRRQEIIDEQTGKSYDIVTILQQGLLAGTD